jgi:hypothetical protein
MPASLYSRRVQDDAVLALRGLARWALSLFKTLILYQSWLVRKQGKGSPEQCHRQKK